jgi:hypothetical protein
MFHNHNFHPEQLTAQTVKPFGFYLEQGRAAMAGQGFRTKLLDASDEQLARVDASFHFSRDLDRARRIAGL